jgi:hypothetical protein
MNCGDYINGEVDTVEFVVVDLLGIKVCWVRTD